MDYPEEKKNIKRNSIWRNNFLGIIGAGLVLSGLAIMVVIYWPLLTAEVEYLFSKKGEDVVVLGSGETTGAVAVAGKEIMQPVDEVFGLLIPKINANAKVVPEVDADQPAVYQRALTQGVAHAKGTGYPGQEGNVFIFAHSGVDLPEALRYNAIFYLLNKMEKGDEIFLFKDGQKFSYSVSEKRIVDPQATSYMDAQPGKKIVTLMTCWPPGTTWKRLIVIGEEKNQ